MYQGWMSLGGQEVWNAERTKTYVRANAPSIELMGCEDCPTLADALRDPPYKNNPVDDDAPWVADDEPDLAQFYGFYPISISGLTDNTSSVTVTESVGPGGSVTAPRRATMEFRVSGLLMAGTAIALDKGRAWLRNMVEGPDCVSSTGGCNGADACFFAACPADEDQGDEYLRTVRDVSLLAGPTTIRVFSPTGPTGCHGGTGAYMEQVEFTFVSVTPYIYGAVDFLGSTMGTEDTTPGQTVMPVERGETHGHLQAVDHYLPFPTGTAVGDLLVTAYGSTQINNTALPTGWVVTFDQATPGYYGKIAYKIADAADVATGTLYVRMNTNGNGDFTMLGFEAGTFDPDHPVATQGVLRPEWANPLPQTLTPWESTDISRTYFFASRGSLSQEITVTPGTKVWSDTSSINAQNNSAALYFQENIQGGLTSPVFDGVPAVPTSHGGFFAAFEVLSVALPSPLLIDQTAPALPECPVTGVSTPPITDPTVPPILAPPRPPPVSISLQPPAPWASGYSVFIRKDHIPETLDAVLIISLTTGTEAARYVRLRMYPAPMGFEQKVSDLDPCSYCGEVIVIYIPPNSTFTIDGMNQSVYITDTAGNIYPAGHLAYSGAGLPTGWAELTCGMGYWLTVEFPGEADPTNLLISGAPKDSSTFNVDVGGWQNGINDGSPRAVLTHVTDVFHEPPGAMKVRWPAGSNDRPQVTISGMTPGLTYQLAGWVRSPQASIALDLGKDLGRVQSAISPDWQHLETSVVADAASQIVRLANTTTSDSGDVWVDELVLRDSTSARYTVARLDVSIAKRE